jgi:hypothetical protein
VDEGQGLVADIGPPRRGPQIQVALDEFSQPQVLGQAGWKQKAGVGEHVRVVEGNPKAVQGVG